jgi:hypothetical protein
MPEEIKAQTELVILHDELAKRKYEFEGYIREIDCLMKIIDEALQTPKET